MRTFEETLQKQNFVLTAELNMARESDPKAVLTQANTLAPHTDAVQIPDNPYARVHMTPLAASNILLQNDILPIPHLSCRDRNRVALESELISLGTMGVTSVLLMRGDDLPDDHRPKVKQVFEMGGKDLLRTARALVDDSSVVSVPDFYIGTVATVFNPKAGWKPRALLAKVEAGARFIQTQLCFDIAALRSYMSHLIQAQLTWNTAVIVSTAALPSATSAKWLRENMRGSVIPNKIIRRLDQARDPELEGVAICTELLQELGEVPGVSGAHIMTPGDIETIPAAINAAGLQR